MRNYLLALTAMFVLMWAASACNPVIEPDVGTEATTLEEVSEQAGLEGICTDMPALARFSIAHVRPFEERGYRVVMITYCREGDGVLTSVFMARGASYPTVRLQSDEILYVCEND